ncbi:MAG TPA: PQQ-dependent sugar dehydrogenase [Rhizomicrobium sp.]|nr:PQQ-dependent sugar dehydrogenase [Rhizomicrobium sp.]
MAAIVTGAAAAQAVDLPGQRFSISPASLPKPHATAAVANDSKVIARPPGALPKAPDGFAVSVFADNLSHARWMTVAPNGDIFLAQSDAGKVVVMRPTSDGTHAAMVSTFAAGFDRPHGLAVHNGSLYVADVKSLWRLRYTDGALRASGERVRLAATTPPQGPGHFTRDIVFDSKGTLYLAIGSRENVGQDPLPFASVQIVNPDGSLSTFASGLRNPVGIAFYPGTDDLYVTVNERDGLGDDLPPDYLTHIQKGDFFGWPYAYIGNNPDPDYGKKRPDLVAKTKTPDVLFEAHSAPLGLVFYDGSQFPSDYKGNAFVSLHGSWNRSHPTGYKVVRVKFTNGRPENAYENFLTGFWDGVSSPARVWGRPVGLVVARDGSLLVADDAGGRVWRVAYKPK